VDKIDPKNNSELSMSRAKAIILNCLIAVMYFICFGYYDKLTEKPLIFASVLIFTNVLAIYQGYLIGKNKQTST